MFDRGDEVVKAGQTTPMTVIAIEEIGRGKKLFVCEWIDDGKRMAARLREDELELYFPPSPSKR